MKYKILERNDDDGYAVVEYQNPKWDKALVVSEKRKITEIDDTGKEITKTVTEKVDRNHHQNHIHRITLPSPVEGEDYDKVTLVRRIEEVGRGVLHKMDIRAVQSQSKG